MNDLGRAIEEAHKMKLTLPGLILACQLYKSALDKGHPKKGV